MFKTAGSVNLDKLKQSLANVERNYIIQPNDYLDIRVFTNKGERIIDPNGELPFGTPGGSSGAGSNTSRGAAAGGARNRGGGGQASQGANTEFLVQFDGTVRLPMLPKEVKLSGLTLLQADSLLQVEYDTFYVKPFVRTRVTNNRVFVMGAVGGGGQIGGGGGGQQGAGGVIVMQDDNMNLLEVLAQVGGIPQGGKAHNIKVIRNYMTQEPIVQIIDLTTIEGMQQASLHIEPNDVVYIEPNQRIFFEVLRDVGPVISTLVGLISTYFIITNLGRN